MNQVIKGVPVHRTKTDVPPNSMSYTAFREVDQWCKRQGWLPYRDFHTAMQSVNDKITMFYRFEDPKKEMMFKLAWSGQ